MQRVTDDCADQTGQVEYRAPEFKIPAEAQGLKLFLTYVRHGQAISESREFVFPAEVFPAADSSLAAVGAKAGAKNSQQRKEEQ
ncbi:MAG TPA: hypothetical protein VN875_17580 [Candidatus Binatus sp.]|nr:hypothetical protein [Candidatus Binatus sp.]